MSLRRVWVIQEKSSGHFLNNDLHLVTSLRAAGRCFDLDSAVDTASTNLDEDFEIHSFFEETRKFGVH